MRSEFASGWRVLLASFVGIAVGVSSLYFYSLGIFIKPMQTEFTWTRAEASLGALVGTLCAAIMAAPIGWLTDRIGSVRIGVLSLLMLAAGFAALGYGVRDLASFLAITALVSLLTAGATPLPFTRLVVSHFERNRGLALGLTLAGTGLGAIMVPRFLTSFIATHGWRDGYYLLALVVAGATPFVWFLLRRAKEPARAADAQNRIRVIAQPAFYGLVLMFFVVSLAILGTVVHFVPMLSDAGLTPEQAGAAASLIGVSAIAGRLAIGLLLDRVGAKWIVSLLFLTTASGLVFLAQAIVAHALAGAVILGLAIGSEGDLLAFLVGRYFPRAVYGRAYGAIYAAFLIGGAAGPFIAGRMFDVFKTYSLWLLLAAALLSLVAISSILLPKPNITALS